MNNKKKCGIIGDLLPLYTENMCSEESRRIVAEHLAECSECSKLLGKMSTDLKIAVDSDVSVIRRIKKRVLTEKIAIAAIVAAVVLLAGWFVYFHLVNTDRSMDYVKCGIAQNVWVEESETGDLWLCKKNEPATATYIMPTISDENGRHLLYDNDYDKEKKNGYGVTLKQRVIDSFAMIQMNVEQEERTLLFNKDEKPEMEKVFYFDDVNNTEHVLWERK